MADPLRCGLRLVDAENARDLVRYHSLLHDDFRGEVDGEVVSWSADDHAVAGVRSWAAEPDARVVVDSAEVAGGFVLLRYRVVRPGGGETPGSLVLEVHGDRIRRSWRYGASGRAPERRPLTLQRVVVTCLVVLGFVGYTIYDELLFSTPVVVSSLALGAPTAFLLWTALYGVAGFAVTTGVVRRYDRWLDGRPGRVQRWLTGEQRRWRWLMRPLVAGRVPAFLLASFALGPIVTMWVIRSAGTRHRLVALSAASTAFWAVTFVGSYVGIASLLP